MEIDDQDFELLVKEIAFTALRDHADEVAEQFDLSDAVIDAIRDRLDPSMNPDLCDESRQIRIS